jgi:hypothetical protein
MTPQTLPVLFVFKTEHTPGTPEHLTVILEKLLAAKGLTLIDGKIEV